jgi:hypothetical protein
MERALMTDLCAPGFTDVADTLGGISCIAPPLVASVRSPLDLANWTLPVVELLMIVGAVASFVHALRRWRRHGDPTNLALWFATVVYVLLLEPPLYFPDRFGLQDQVGLIFVHNLFSVQFLYDRLPLYIVALYPALTYLAYALVQRTGALERRSPLVGAASVALVFHAFYEIFDNIGPQLRWWAWNPDAPTNEPWLASVPMTSVVMFAGASPFGIALLTRWLIARRAARGPVPWWSMTLRVIGVGALTPVAMLVFSLPYSVVPPERQGLRAAVLWTEIALVAAVGAYGIVRTLRERADESPADPIPHRDHYGVVAGAVFLGVFAVLWATALPGHADAVDGLTPDGAPVGSLPYAVACAVVVVAVLAAVSRRPAPPLTRSAEPQRSEVLR